MKSAAQVIKDRKSIRTFEKKDIQQSDLDRIKRYINDKSNKTGPFGNECKFKVIKSVKGDSKDGAKVGTYGIIKNPAAYIAGFTKNSPEAMVDFGYNMEKLILMLTSMEIGTCWLGGTFSRNSFDEQVSLSKDEIIPCVTPIGYIMQNKSLIEKAMRIAVKADKRKPASELFFYKEASNPVKDYDRKIPNAALEMVRLGPSASNKQPWRVIIAEDFLSYHFYLEKTPNYAGNKMGFDMQRIDMGIAMAHFELGCEASGVKGRWSFDKPDINTSLEYIATFIADNKTESSK